MDRIAGQVINICLDVLVTLISDNKKFSSDVISSAAVLLVLWLSVHLWLQQILLHDLLVMLVAGFFQRIHGLYQLLPNSV